MKLVNSLSVTIAITDIRIAGRSVFKAKFKEFDSLNYDDDCIKLLPGESLDISGVDGESEMLWIEFPEGLHKKDEI